MSTYLNNQNIYIIKNIISKTKIKNNQYNWGNFIQATDKSGIKIGWAEYEGEQAKKLLQLIQLNYPNDFRKNDKANIASDIKNSFLTYKIKRNSLKAKSIINIIKSQGGKKIQNKMFLEKIKKYIYNAIEYGIDRNNIKTIALWCTIEFLQGETYVKQIFNQCSQNPNINEIIIVIKQNNNNSYDYCYSQINKIIKEHENNFYELHFLKSFSGIVTADALWVRQGPEKSYPPLKSIPVI